MSGIAAAHQLAVRAGVSRIVLVDLLATYILDCPRPDYASAFHPARFQNPTYQHVLATLDSKRQSTLTGSRSTSMNGTA